MAFDIEQWKTQVFVRYQKLKDGLGRESAAQLYAFLSVTALWPVLEAAQRGDWGAVGTLASLTAVNLGTNLLADQIQNWKDETSTIHQVNEALKHDSGLRAELDLVLQKLDAIAIAEKSLSESDKAWFGETLQHELEMLKSGITYIASVSDSGAIAQGDNSNATGKDSILVNGHVEKTNIINGDGNQIVNNNFFGSSTDKTLLIEDAIPKYLEYLIAYHQHLRLQGIRAGSQPLSVSLEKVYISLTVVDKHVQQNGQDDTDIPQAGPGTLSIASALQKYRRLVIIGDPGSGKTTLLAYLTLTYARANKGGIELMRERLSLQEADHLPILLPLRDLGQHLHQNASNPGSDGSALLLDYLYEYYEAQNINLPEEFFTPPLESGKAIVLLDGMDEVADITLRQRVARLIEKFAARYPKCRFIVTSREVGYDGPARIGAEFNLARVREFTPGEVRQFIRDWSRVVETTLAQNESPDVINLADTQAAKLIQAIDNNPRVAELAVNPLLLTVVALVHRYRAQLPERRSELYEEAIEVLLGHWDEAKGLDSDTDVSGITLDSGDRRSLLEPVALWLHKLNRREIEKDELRPLLVPAFEVLTSSPLQASKAFENFLKVVNARSGLLIERGIGIYSFAHLTFQEYLAARALADSKDALSFTIKVMTDPWWREVILLQAGYLSTQGKYRVSELIRALMNAKLDNEPEPFHNLLLAAECLSDVGNARVDGNLLGEVRSQLQTQADLPIKKGNKLSLMGKLGAMNALARIESGTFISQFWKAPWGEPIWATIAEGKFFIGNDDGRYDDEEPIHLLYLPEYQIARVPVTNAQYAIYIKDSNAQPPEHWRSGKIPSGLENHPVVNVSWYDAIVYCQWLSEKLKKPINLPSEAEWEKAACGPTQSAIEKFTKYSYSWGKNWQEWQCNSEELGLGSTTPVGLFINNASFYGVLDMSGNIWEWTRSIYYPYPYQPNDGRENLGTDSFRTLRGGSWGSTKNYMRVSARNKFSPSDRYDFCGFRIAIASSNASTGLLHKESSYANAHNFLED